MSGFFWEKLKQTAGVVAGNADRQVQLVNSGNERSFQNLQTCINPAATRALHLQDSKHLKPLKLVFKRYSRLFKREKHYYIKAKED